MDALLSPKRPQITVPAGSEILLRDLVHLRTGTYFDKSNFYLMIDKLTPLIVSNGFSSLLDFYFFMKNRPHFSDEWRRVIDALSVQETYFWREMDQVNTLVNQIVPEWFSKSNDLLRIWVAACASGEEAFTIAIALEEAGWGRHPIKIVATDASEAALQKGQTGIFRERSFRAMPPELRTKYFNPIRGNWALKPEILSRVRFERVNIIVRTETAELAPSPVIFCRNVFIYFSPDVVAQTVRSFAERMPPGGYLCVGASESLLRLTNDFDLREIGNAFVYVRKQRLGPFHE